MGGRFGFGIGVQTTKTQNHLGLFGPLGHQVGSAFSAKVPDLPGCRFEMAEELSPSTPFEVGPLSPSCRRECRAVSLSTSLATAMKYRSRETLSLELYCPTKTTSPKHMNLLKRANKVLDEMPHIPLKSSCSILS